MLKLLKNLRPRKHWAVYAIGAASGQAYVHDLCWTRRGASKRRAARERQFPKMHVTIVHEVNP